MIGQQKNNLLSKSYGNNEIYLENSALTFDQLMFFLGLYAKQFYLLPSGSFQLGDFLLLLAFISFLLKKKLYLAIGKDEMILITFFLCTVVINVIYFSIYKTVDFLKSSLYYLFNVIIILYCTSVFNDDKVCPFFMKRLLHVLQLILLTQALVYLSGNGKWFFVIRYGGTFNDPNQYSVFILFSALLIYMISRTLNMNSSIWIILSFALNIPSSSTGVLVAYIVFVGTFILIKLYRVGKKEFIFLTLTFIVVFVLAAGLLSGIIKLPEFISNNTLYLRFISKINVVFSGTSSSIVADRGWESLVENPEYILWGAGEGNFKRFDAKLEIHSSILGPLFYYGIIPLSFLTFWVAKKLKNLNRNFICFYSALFSVAFFLVNNRQPLFWILICIAGVSVFKNSKNAIDIVV